MRRRRGIAIAAVAALLVVLTAACGGGGGDGVAFEGETVRSGDGVLTLEIPAGAAAEGIEIEVTRIADGDLPQELQGVDGVVVVGYELGPDGAQFSQPVTLTFRVDPADHGIDLPEGAVPLGLLLTENADGDLESLPGEVSYEDGELVVRAAMTHFSPAIFVFDDNSAVLLEPREIELAVGGQRDVKVVARDLGTGEPIEFSAAVPRWTTTAPFTVDAGEPEEPVTISCTAPTDGWVPDAYSVVIPSSAGTWGSATAFIHVMREVFADFVAPLGIKLAGRGKCDALSGTATLSPTATPWTGPRTDITYPVTVSGTSGSVELNTSDCFNEDGIVDECLDAVDIAEVSWAVDGPLDLLTLTVRFVGPFAGPDRIIADVGIGGSGVTLSNRLTLAGGEVTCVFFPDGPLDGESCGVDAEGRIVVIRQISGLPGEIRMDAYASYGPPGSEVQDAVQIEGIAHP